MFLYIYNHIFIWHYFCCALFICSIAVGHVWCCLSQLDVLHSRVDVLHSKQKTLKKEYAESRLG